MAENRTATPTPESAVGAFGIQPDGEDINFHWDVLVFRVVQGMQGLQTPVSSCRPQAETASDIG